MFPSWVMLYKLSKIVHYLQFCADASKNSMVAKVVCVCAFDIYDYSVASNGIVVGFQSHNLPDIKD